MEIEEVRRRLEIGFMQNLSLEERDYYVKGGFTSREAAEAHPGSRIRETDVRDALEWLKASPENKIWWYGSECYPVFGDIRGPLPYMLFLNGNAPDYPALRLSVVGTRRADNMGLQSAYMLGLEAGVNGVEVVSGLADGCDQASLSGAADAGCACFAVLGCGLAVDYPRYTGALKKRIARSGGAVMSQFPPHSPGYPSNFPIRNIVIAAMGDAAIVVQAPSRSGALITTRYALELNKDVYVSRSGIGDRFNRAGSRALAESGARVVSSVRGIWSVPLSVREISGDEEKRIAEGFECRFGNKTYIVEKNY